MSLSESSENEDDLEDRLITECRNKFLKAMRVFSLMTQSINTEIGRIL